MAQTSDEVSKLAARYLALTPDRLLGMTATERLRQETTADIKSMAASLLRQDEVKGVRGFVRKLIGRN